MYDSVPGHCPFCKVNWEWVRPGKSQPTCDCQDYCSCGTRIEYHGEADPRWPNVLGYYCPKCGPCYVPR